MRPMLLVLIVLVTFAFRSQAPRPLHDDVRPAGVEDVELIFSHRLHVMEQELACEDCHADVETSTSGLENHLPSMELCGDCHNVEDADNCTECHSEPDDPRIVPRIDEFSPVFSHAQHMEAEDATCESCHPGVDMQEQAPEASLPGMVTCMSCHDDRRVENECATCHLPGEPLVPDSHTPDFIHAHGQLARNEEVGPNLEKTCATCHDDAFCQDCHEGDNLERFTHPLNYAFTHALDAQLGEHDCATCHSDRQFCEDCHRDFQVMPQTHTAGWVTPIGGGRHRHEARRDLESCMACHESNADVVCTPCHAIAN